MTDQTLFDLSRSARETGFYCTLGPSGDGPDGGFADPGAILVTGKDSGPFLHAQLTNDVTGLAPGQGNLSARVRRTGHLLNWFSVHCMPASSADEPLRFLLILERSCVAGLMADLDGYLFADQVQLEDHTDRYEWHMIQGPRAAAMASSALGPLAGADWESVAAESIHRCAADWLPAGSLVIARSFTGDPGFLLLFPAADPVATNLGETLRNAAREHDLATPVPAVRDALLETLRIEAGLIRVGADTPGKERLLPETGLERQTVSYTKGCYLGQEVIARVRTYGSVAYGLMGLVVRGVAERESDDAATTLARIPEPGADLLLDEQGNRVGQWTSRAASPLIDQAIALAYLDRTHRTPGSIHQLRGIDGPLRCTVTLLPFHRAHNLDEQVGALYDRAVRSFAEGDGETALSLLEQALRLDPSFEDGYEAVGVILGRSERFHEAIDFFRRLEEVAPDEPIVNTNLSLYYMKLGDKTTAEAEAARALEKDLARSTGDDRSSTERAEEAQAQRRQDALRKKEMFAQVLEIDAEDGVALFGLGNALATLNEFEQAESFYSRASAAQKDNSAVYLEWGKTLERLDQPERALEVYARGLEVAARKGDFMPLKEMEHRKLLLSPN